MPSAVYLRALQRAAELAGGPAALAVRLNMPVTRIERWLEGREPVPVPVFLETVDLLTTFEKPRARAEVPDWVRDLGERTLRSATTLHGTDLGTLQVRNPEGDLELVAHRGFGEEFVEYFRFVDGGDPCACGTALASAQRVYVPNLDAGSLFDASPETREVLRRAQVLAVQSTPIVAASDGGGVLGMISTHWRMPRVPDEDLHPLEPIVQPLAMALQRALA
jgi:hypothetical protein